MRCLTAKGSMPINIEASTGLFADRPTVPREPPTHERHAERRPNLSRKANGPRGPSPPRHVDAHALRGGTADAADKCSGRRVLFSTYGSDTYCSRVIIIRARTGIITAFKIVYAQNRRNNFVQ